MQLPQKKPRFLPLGSLCGGKSSYSFYPPYSLHSSPRRHSYQSIAPTWKQAQDPLTKKESMKKKWYEGKKKKTLLFLWHSAWWPLRWQKQWYAVKIDNCQHEGDWTTAGKDYGYIFLCVQKYVFHSQQRGSYDSISSYRNKCALWPLAQRGLGSTPVTKSGTLRSLYQRHSACMWPMHVL